ncbi:MAG: hypothetical protein DRP89_01155, partial [Candidatus Neomarinimicrobiota bacterium]
MKKLLLCIFVIALTAVIAFPQSWQVVKQQSIEFQTNDGYFLDANTGWLIGDDGEVWKTVNGGQDWTIVRAADGSGIDWNNVQFYDADTGYACADKGYIFKTVDGGLNWTMVGDTANYKNTLKDVAVVTADIVYFAGNDWTLLKTDNGGSTYTVQGDSATFQGVDLDGGIDFYDANNGVVLADGSGGMTWYTHDGGTNWNFVSVGPLFPVGLSSSRIYDVAVGPNSTVVIGAYHYCVFVSTDGGETYTRSGDFDYGYEYFGSVSVIDAQTFFIGGTDGHVIKTVDGGTNWDTLYVGSGQKVRFIHFVDADNGYVFSYYGQWFKTTDGGVNFTPLLEWPQMSFWGLALPTDNKIVLTAYNGGEMTISEDGGLTWSYPNNYATGCHESIYECEFIDENNGMFAGAYGTLSKTVDGGASWSHLDNSFDGTTHTFNALHYWNIDTVYVGGYSGNIWRSTDGGTTWDENDYGSGTIYDIWPISATKIIASAGSGKIYISDTTGGTFSFVEAHDYGSMSMRAVEFRGDVGIIPASSGHIYRTTIADWDTLKEVFTDPDGDDLYDVEFVTDSIVFVVGEAGKIYKSTDAGLTWTAEASPADNVLDKVRYRNNKVWAIGKDGIILKCDLTRIPISIAEAKVDANEDFVPDLLGETVTIQGVITTPNYTSGTSYYLQDATAGISLYTSSFASALNIGDEIKVSGEIAQYKGLTEITPASETDVTVLSTGNDFDTTLVTIPDFGESIESQLVQLNNVWLVDPTAWPSEGSNANLDITDGTDTLTMRIDKDTDLDGWLNPPSGTFNVIGIVGQYTSSTPPNDGYQMTPRFRSDFFGYGITITIAAE